MSAGIEDRVMRGKISTSSTALVLASMLLASWPALAQTQTRTLTCAQAARLVEQKGAVVLATSPIVYDRYVRDRSFCVYDQDLKPEWVPTRDVEQCFIGYTCFEPYRGGGRAGH